MNYKSITNPKSNDTDEDGFNDGFEIIQDTDPNIHDLPTPPEINITQPTDNQTFFYSSNITISAAITSDYVVDYEISIWDYGGDFVELIASNTTPVGGDTILTYWNSSGKLPGRYVIKVNATDIYNPTVYATRPFVIKNISLSNENPLNGATNQLLSLTWSIGIYHALGGTFNWIIICTDGVAFEDNATGTGETNGTKSLVLTTLGSATLYFVTVTVVEQDGMLSQANYTFETGPGLVLNISIIPNSLNFGIVNVGDSDWTSDYYFNMFNNGMDCYITISATNTQNWTFVNWVSRGHNKFCTNFSKDNWATEINVADDGNTELIDNLPTYGSLLFDIKTILPTSMSTMSDGESYIITFTATAN